ncbi:MAG: hypothetical protein KDK39_16850 [Leptospiraceae bacterium]|nr:hypothetical protein [Leptospiraceae bacterium]
MARRLLYICESKQRAQLFLNGLDEAQLEELVEFAFQWQDGLESHQDDRFDLILSDASLLADSPRDVTRQLLPLVSQRVFFPLVIVGHTKVDRRRAGWALENGAYDCLCMDPQSGFDRDELQRCIDQTIADSQLYEQNLLDPGKTQVPQTDDQKESFFLSVPDIVYRINPVGQFIYFKSQQNLLGYRVDEILGQHYQTLIHPADLAHVQRSSALETIQSGSVAPGLFDERRQGQRMTRNKELRLLKKGAPGQAGGSWLWANLHASGVFTNSVCLGKLFVGSFGVLSDISFRKEAEEHLQQVNQALELRVQQRTAELAHANKELEAFAYTVSHDLRSPMKKISNLAAEIMQQEAFTGSVEIQGKIESIQRYALQTTRFMDDLLVYSRSGRTSLNWRMLRVNTVVAECCDILEEECRNRSIEWQISDLGQIAGDLSLVRQVFLNLLSNALKYTARQAETRIQIWRTNNRMGLGCIHIKDNGAGFKAEYKDRLFGVFTRLHAEEDFAGNGIGLATVRTIIDRHGGHIEAEGAEGEGACFQVCLPLAIPVKPDD